VLQDVITSMVHTVVFKAGCGASLMGFQWRNRLHLRYAACPTVHLSLPIALTGCRQDAVNLLNASTWHASPFNHPAAGMYCMTCCLACGHFIRQSAWPCWASL